MKAVFLEKHGGGEVLKFGELPDPQPQPTEVVIHLKAAALNHIDIWIRNGIPAYPVKFPHILGSDGAGIVEEIGAEVEGVSKGDSVVILPGIFGPLPAGFPRSHENQGPAFEVLGSKRNGKMRPPSSMRKEWPNTAMAIFKGRWNPSVRRSGSSPMMSPLKNFAGASKVSPPSLRWNWGMTKRGP